MVLAENNPQRLRCLKTQTNKQTNNAKTFHRPSVLEPHHLTVEWHSQESHWRGGLPFIGDVVSVFSNCS